MKGIPDAIVADWERKGLIAPQHPTTPIIDEGQSEKEFQADVIKFAKRNGWDDVYHTYNSKRSAPGFLDCVFARESRAPHVIVAELKVGDNQPTEDQERWLNYFRAAGVPTFVWWPKDWAEIMETLR